VSGNQRFVTFDVMLPRLDGVRVCRTLREFERWCPVLMLTARDGVADRIRGLDAGADDYLVKPFDFGELVARLRATRRGRVRVARVWDWRSAARSSSPTAGESGSRTARPSTTGTTAARRGAQRSA
jgi:DNA-binding response OmpR family regulator